MTIHQKAELGYRWSFWSRPEQLPPPGGWSTWIYVAGRGSGKTRSGAEWIRWQIEYGGKNRVALIAPTAGDTRDVMVEGESGLLNICPPWNRPKYEPSKRRVTWPNGAIATLYSADEPERLRGPQHDAGWCDEIASWRYPEASWSNYQFGLRLGDNPQTVATSTPKPTPFIRKLLAATGVVITRGTTYDNRVNLAEAFFEQIIKDYEGTRLGRQELLAELLNDNPDALWKLETMIEPFRVREAPVLERVVVAVDPAISHGSASDETGIIVAGKTSGNHLYVLDDLSLRASPDGWARAAITAYHNHQADRIVAESNQGGEMVEQTLRTIDPYVPIELVHATRGKLIRAEPVAALYEQGRGHHVGVFSQLESQLTDWTPGQKSPDRLDALVWAATKLIVNSTKIPLADEPDPGIAPPEQDIRQAIKKAQLDPFAWDDQHNIW